MSARLFGRSWRVQVLTPADSAGSQMLLDISSSDRETQSLRVQFDIQQMYGAYFNAEVRIYNPNLTLIKTLEAGCVVSVSAGYTSEGEPAEIFRGPLYQSTVGRPDGCTTVLTLLSVLGINELANSFMRVTVGPLATQRETVLAMAQNCLKADGTYASIPIAYLAPDSDFKRGALPRSQTIFGTPNTLFANIARANDMGFAMGSNGLSLGKLDGTKKNTPDMIYAPPLQDGSSPEAGVDYRLIGVPEQTQLGVDFRVLLDSRLTFKLPALQAQLNNVVIEQASFPSAFQSGQFQSVLTQDGIYFVAGVEHIGDTRGNEWETRVVGMSSINGVLPPGAYQ